VAEVLVVCEGHTEREFCQTLIAPYLGQLGIELAGTLVGKAQRKQGGIRDWSVYRGDLIRLAKERAGRSVAVLVDYYAMPQSWPGRAEADARAASERGRHVETRLRADLARELPDRFIPCVQLHEFESLLFVQPEVTAQRLAALGGSVAVADLAESLVRIVDSCGGRVELINDSPVTAPSKRVTQLVPAYDKVAWGLMVARAVGLDGLRAGCPWLDRWLNSLRALKQD